MIFERENKQKSVQPSYNMQLFTGLFALLALTIIQGASAAVWNDKLKLWNIGRVKTTTTKYGKYKTFPVWYVGA